ncbi:MAG: CPBP family intramembrane metalloprotease [Parvularculaceae bacterium]|jgi:membrane protease YdiL (CAAX protease family)|nr:CPBP family intramembrane metalloprotease [Parvularculaceae bacterium]
MLLGLASAAFSGPILRPLLSATPLAEIRYGVSTAINLVDLAVLAAVILALGGRDGRNLLAVSGLSAPIARPALFAAAILGPLAATAALLAPVADDLDPIALGMTGIAFPAMEEIGFRGLAIGALMRLCGWRFPPAALAPAALFGLAHLAQGDAPAEIAGVVAVTALGGLLFGWLFVRWGFNLWPPIFLHAGLNTAWSVFDLGDNAVGGWLGNALRLGAVAAAIGLTLLLSPRMKESKEPRV